MNPLLPHHDGSSLYVSETAPSLGDQVSVRLRIPHEYPELERVWVRSTPDHEPAWDCAELLGQAQGFTWWQASVTVANPQHRYRWLLVHDDSSAEGRAPTLRWLNQRGVTAAEPSDASDFTLLAHPAAPKWLHESVMYQIFPDRFARSEKAVGRKLPDWAVAADWEDAVDPVMPARISQFYGGDLDGIVDKLEHLKSLGINLLYLTPIFPARSNHRYDASSFSAIDPLLGGEDAYIRLIETAHAFGIKIIGDLTTNHSGDRHEWFQRALTDPESPERSYYYLREGPEDQRPSYESWLGEASLPKFDWRSPELRRAFIEGPESVVAKWLKPPFNLDGWRIDAANMTGRLGSVDVNQQVRTALRRTMDSVKPDSILLAEITNDSGGDLTGDAWNGAMTYPSFTRPLWSWLSAPTAEPYITAEGAVRTEPWYFGQPTGGIPESTAADFAEAVQEFNSRLPWRIRLGNMQALDTHDTARFATNAARGAVPVAVGLQMTLPGVPTLFAGDEFGVTGADGELSRTPIPWSQIEEKATADRIRLYRDLIGLRKCCPVLTTGGMRWLLADEQAVAFIRESAQECVLVFAAAPNRSAGSDEGVAAEMPLTAAAGLEVAELLWGDAQLSCSAGTATFSSTGMSFTAWRLPGVVVP